MAAAGVEDEDAGYPSVRRRSQMATVLVVEDETPLRQLVCKILTGARYQVLAAANGQEALLLAAHSAKPIDLLLTDVLMPGMSGPELMDKLRQSRPELVVLFMSGYDRELLGQRELGPALKFLPKPFTPQALLAVVNDLVESGAAGSPGMPVRRRQAGQRPENA
jgi:CheY-like chemotaxis protein